MEQTPNPKCGRCYNYWKPDENDIKTSGLLYKTCKKCRITSRLKQKKYLEEDKNIFKHKQRQAKYYQNNTDKLLERQKQYRENNKDKIKEASKKYKNKNADKILERRKQYRENNKDKIKEASKKYYQDNADKIKTKTKKYSQEHPDIRRKAVRDWIIRNKCEHNKRLGECIICNTSLYLLNLQRGQIRRCLKISTQNKTKTSIEYLGCDAVYFKDYIQKKMDIYNQTAEVKMDFNNIHIDHIKPVSSFNLEDEDEFLNCCNYTNLQPLLIKDNLSKNDKWTDEDDKYWNDNIKDKEHLDIYI